MKDKKSVAALGHSDLLPVHKSKIFSMLISQEMLSQTLVRFSENDLQMESF